MYIFSLLAGSNCPCPPTTSLEAIPDTTCPKNMGQIQRDYFNRRGVQFDIATPANNLPATIAGEVIEDETAWNTMFAANTVIKSPLVGGDPTITPSAPITNGGGDNSTLNGQVNYNGTNPAEVSRRFDSLDKEQIAAMRKLQCEGTLEVWLIDQFGNIWGYEKDGIATGIPVSNFYVGTKSNEGFATRDSNVITYQIPADYDEYLTRYKPNGWNPLTA